MVYQLLIFILLTVVSADGREGLFDDHLYKEVLDPELCQKQLASMSAFEFYDASFRIPQGLLKGGLSSLGNFHQCLGIKQENDGKLVEGKYCMTQVTLDTESYQNIPASGNPWFEKDWSKVNVTAAMEEMEKYNGIIDKLTKLAATNNDMVNPQSMLNNLQLSLAVCIPKACSVDDVMAPLSAISPVPFSYTEQFCRLPDDKPFSAADYIAVAFLLVLGVLTALSTTYDLHHLFVLKRDPKEANKLYRCCSVYTNMSELLTFSKTPGKLDCLDGMRSLSILWIVLGHVYSTYLMVYASNLVDFYEWFGKKRAIWLLSSDVSVDTFFTMSGLLLVYTTANKMDGIKLLKNLHWFYLNRLLRMFPLLAFILLLQASVFFRVTDGPNWWFLGNQVQNCREYWWSTLLHVQNWVNPFTACLPQTWYLSTDIQLHMASPLLLFWILRGRRSAISGLAVGLTALLAANMIFCFVSDFSDAAFHMKYYYNNPLVRSMPFIIGMLCGYILHRLRRTQLRLPMWALVTGYSLALVCSSYAMYQAYPDWQSSVIIDLNYTFEKSLWALSICWLVFACVCGYGGPINWFLSLTVWKFTARISYAMYLIHFPVMFMDAGALTVPYYYSMENIFFTFAGATAYTVIVSVAACVLVDAPLSTLQKMMLTALNPPAKSTPTIKTTATMSPENIPHKNPA